LIQSLSGSKYPDRNLGYGAVALIRRNRMPNFFKKFGPNSLNEFGSPVFAERFHLDRQFGVQFGYQQHLHFAGIRVCQPL